MPRFEEFEIGRLFAFSNPPGKYNANAVRIHATRSSESMHPYIVRTKENNGRRGFIVADESALCPANTLSFGQDTATVFYQREPYFTGDKIKVLKPRFELTEAIACYVIASMRKSFDGFRWGQNRFEQSVLEQNAIALPILVQADGNPYQDEKALYHDCGFVPDWNGMSRYITSIEKEHLAMRRRSNEEKVRLCLAASDMSDCVTSEDDRMVIEKVHRHLHRFKAGRVFRKVRTWRRKGNFDKKLDVSEAPTEEFRLSLVNAKKGSNGIMFYGRPADFSAHEKVLGVIQNGAAATGLVYAHIEPVGVLWDAYLLEPMVEGISENQLLFLASALQKSTRSAFDWDNKATWDRVKEVPVPLPYLHGSDGTPRVDKHRTFDDLGYIPDWNIMDSYIRSMRKLAIADLIERNAQEDAVIDAIAADLAAGQLDGRTRITTDLGSASDPVSSMK